jgi:hypothetical protein
MITENQIQNYLNHITKKYHQFHVDMAFSSPAVSVEKFANGLKAIDGKSYIKIVKEGSVHSFIVKADNGKFKAGDVLKAASWSAPAKNFARGNIITGEIEQIDWSM